MWRNTMTTVTNKENYLTGAGLRVQWFSPSLSWWEPQQHTGSHGAGEEAKPLNQQRAGREQHWPGLGFWNLQSPSPMTHFLQQHSTTFLNQSLKVYIPPNQITVTPITEMPQSLIPHWLLLCYLWETVSHPLEQWFSTCGTRYLWGSNNPSTGVT